MTTSPSVAAITLLLALAGTCLAGGARTGSWGDQGDGTYKNPILNADYPDVDIEKFGDTWYMITSTVTYAPGMTILESKDLVNWSLVGHMWDKLTWSPEYDWRRMERYGMGVWAADLARHEGRWYCYFIDASEGLFVSWAKAIRGPWSKPACMLKKKHWTDPAVFWDYDKKQAYLICNFGSRHGAAGKEGNEIRLFRMNWDGLSLQDGGKGIYYGGGAEAAKIYKIGGTYYILLAQWIDGDRKQLVLRGKDLYAPLERKIIMERYPKSTMQDNCRSVCQGSLLEAPDGSWWLTHQLVQHRGHKVGQVGGKAGRSTTQSYEGRSQWLVPIEWKDGWPTVPHDPDANGIGNTVAGARKPVPGMPITAPQTDDEFDTARLGPQWQWNHNPRDAFWSLTERPGWLRLKAAVPVGKGGFWGAANTISQRIMGMGKGEATAKVDISAMKPGQRAGLCRHSGQYVLIGIHVEPSGTRRLFFDHNGKRQTGPAIKADIIYYRTTNAGRHAAFAYSLDGRTWKPFGEPFELTFGRWRGDRLGFFCWNDRQPQGQIDIDYFHYTYDGPQAATGSKKAGSTPE